MIKLGPKTVLGHFGEFHPKTLETLDAVRPALRLRGLRRRHSGAEGQADAHQAEAGPVRLPGGEARLRLRCRQARWRPAPDPARRCRADKKLITGVSVFDLFEGASLGEGKKSVAIEVAIQPVERTLTDEDFEALAGRIVENVKKQTGGVLRG